MASLRGILIHSLLTARSDDSRQQVFTRLFFILLVIVSIPAHAAELRFGTVSWPGYEPLYIARDKGELDDSVKLIHFRSATQVMTALSSGAIEGGSLTLGEVLLLTSQGTEMAIVQVADMSNGGDVILAKPDITHMSELVGKTVIIENSALGAYILYRACEIHDIDCDSINLRYASSNKHEREFSAEDVAAVVTYEPMSTRLRNQGAKEIFSSREIKNEIVDVFAFRQDVVDNPIHQIRIGHLLKAWQFSLQEINDHPDAAYEFLGKRMKLSGADTKEAYKTLELVSTEKNLAIMTDSKQLTETIAKRAQFLSTNGVIESDRKVPVLYLIDNIERK